MIKQSVLLTVLYTTKPLNNIDEGDFTGEILMSSYKEFFSWFMYLTAKDYRLCLLHGTAW
jgi:hypothetical protein